MVPPRTPSFASVSVNGGKRGRAKPALASSYTSSNWRKRTPFLTANASWSLLK
jgi:hypothetical protein